MSIEFLLDENIPYALIDFLQSGGFSASHLKKIGKAGIKNGEVYELAERRHIWIVTRDADFQNYRRSTTHNVGGIVLFKLTRTKTEFMLDAMQRLLDKYKDKLSDKHLIIVEDKEIKVYR